MERKYCFGLSIQHRMGSIELVRSFDKAFLYNLMKKLPPLRNGNYYKVWEYISE